MLVRKPFLKGLYFLATYFLLEKDRILHTVLGKDRKHVGMYRKLHGPRSINEKSHACLAKCLYILRYIFIVNI